LCGGCGSSATGTRRPTCEPPSLGTSATVSVYGVVAVTAVAKKGQEFKQKVIIEGAETPFRIKLPEKPLELALNKYGGILSHEAKVNQGW